MTHQSEKNTFLQDAYKRDESRRTQGEPQCRQLLNTC